MLLGTYDPNHVAAARCIKYADKAEKDLRLEKGDVLFHFQVSGLGERVPTTALDSYS